MFEALSDVYTIAAWAAVGFWWVKVITGDK